MPKSKRNKQIELAKTKKRGLEWKKHLFEEVRSCVDSYTNVFVFSVNDMRNSKMKTVREQWKHSRFFIGKNKIMSMALGRFAEEEYKPNLHKVGQEIRGQRGLLFSNKSTEEVLNWFRSYSEGDFARSGNVSTEEVRLAAGPLPMFPHSLEPYLRQLGLPTSLVKGEIHLVKDHEVCKAGDSLTPESAKILKLLGYEMAEFHITIECMWSHDGSFIKFTENVATDSKEKVKGKKKKSIDKKSPPEMEILDEDMEMELDKNLDEMKNGDLQEDAKETNESLTTVSNSPVTTTSPQKAQNESSADSNEVPKDKMTENVDTDSKENVKEKKKKKKKKFVNKKSTPEGKILDEDMEMELDKNLDEMTNGDLEDDTKEPNEPLTTVSNTPVTISSTPKARNESSADSIVVSKNEIEEVIAIIDAQASNVKVLDNQTSDVDEQASDVVNKDKSSTENTRPVTKRTRKSKAAVKRDSLLKTPDANTSQDSPVFRQLRNRSVKVNRKRK